MASVLGKVVREGRSEKDVLGAEQAKQQMVETKGLHRGGVNITLDHEYYEITVQYGAKVCTQCNIDR